MKNIMVLWLLIFVQYTIYTQTIQNYLSSIEEYYFYDGENEVPFFESKYYKDLSTNPKYEYLNTIVDYTKIDSSIMFDQDTLGEGNLYQYIDPLLLLNDVQNIGLVENLYKEYVDQFCDRWDGIIGSDNETYDNYRFIRLTPLGSADRFVMYALHNVLVSYKLHDFRNQPEAIIRVFETGKVDHLNYPILEYQHKCLPKLYWGPATQLNSNVFLPYKDIIYDFLKETIMNMGFPPDSESNLRNYKNYSYFVQNGDLFKGVIDEDIEQYALNNIEYWIESNAGSRLNAIAFQSTNESFKRDYMSRFLDVYLPSITLDYRETLFHRNMINGLLGYNYDLVAEKIIDYEREIRRDKTYHKGFLLNVLRSTPLTTKFYNSFSVNTHDEEINKNLKLCLRNMAYNAKEMVEDPKAKTNVPKSQKLSKKEINQIIRQIEKEGVD